MDIAKENTLPYSKKKLFHLYFYIKSQVLRLIFFFILNAYQFYVKLRRFDYLI